MRRVKFGFIFKLSFQVSQTWSLCCLTLLVASSLALIQELDMPPDLMHCYESFDRMSNASATVGETIHHYCLRHFLWKTERVRWSGFNITQKDMDYINSLLDSVIYIYIYFFVESVSFWHKCAECADEVYFDQVPMQ